MPRFTEMAERPTPRFCESHAAPRRAGGHTRDSHNLGQAFSAVPLKALPEKLLFKAADAATGDVFEGCLYAGLCADPAPRQPERGRLGRGGLLAALVVAVQPLGALGRQRRVATEQTAHPTAAGRPRWLLGILWLLWDGAAIAGRGPALEEGLEAQFLVSHPRRRHLKCTKYHCRFQQNPVS